VKQLRSLIARQGTRLTLTAVVIAGVAAFYVDRQFATLMRNVQESETTGYFNLPLQQAFRLQVLAPLVVLFLALWIWGYRYVRRHLQDPIGNMEQVVNAWLAEDLNARVRSTGHRLLDSLALKLDHLVEQWIRQSRHLRSQENYLHTVLDAMNEGVFVTDGMGRIVITNPAFRHLTRTSTIEGKTIAEVTRNAELQTIVLYALAGNHVSEEVRLNSAPKRPWVAVHAAPMPDKQGIVAIMHDVTTLKEGEKARRDFVANASHELRTPLTAIRGFAEALRDGALSDSAMAGRFIATILENSKRLEALVNDLLELSRLESLQIELILVRVDCGLVIANVVQSLQAQAKGKEVRFDWQLPNRPMFAKADPRALDQVLLNLLSNAVKYTTENSIVTIRLREDDKHVIIEVIDDGPGIPDSKKERIFERFYRIDRGRSRDAGGTGLGLAIAKQWVEHMHGQVNVSNEPGRGACFQVILQRDFDESVPEAAEHEAQ